MCTIGMGRFGTLYDVLTFLISKKFNNLLKVNEINLVDDFEFKIIHHSDTLDYEVLYERKYKNG